MPPASPIPLQAELAKPVVDEPQDEPITCEPKTTPIKRLWFTTAEVMQRDGIRGTATLWRWRKTKGFPNPLHGGMYNIEEIERWERESRLQE